MGDFTIFYQNGGVFMHLITLTGAIGCAAALLHGRSRRLGLDKHKLTLLAERMAWLGLAVGLLGTLFGVIDMSAALASIDPEQLGTVEFLQAGARGMGIAPTTTVWGLMCAIPLWVATTVQRTRGGAHKPAAVTPG